MRGYIVFTMLMGVLFFVGWHLLHVLEIVYVSALFAVVLAPVVTSMQKLKIRGWSPSEPIAVVALLIALFGGLTLLFYLGLPPVIRDFKEFASDLPSRIPELMNKLHRVPMADKLGLASAANHVQSAMAATAEYLVGALPLWAMHVFDIITALVLTIYFIFDGDQVYKYFLSMVRLPLRTRLEKMAIRAEDRVSHWLIGQLTLMGIQGAYSLVVFGFLHIRYFVLLGILMGITNIIPVAGNLVTVIIVFCIAAADSWTKALIMLAFYIAYTQVENAFLTPRIMRHSVDLMGIAVLTALMAGSELAGIVGALVAVPSAALIAVLLDEFLVQPDHPEMKEPPPLHKQAG